MSLLRVRRNLKDMEKVSDDDSSECSESCTSGSSFKPSGIGTDTDSSVDDFGVETGSKTENEDVALLKQAPIVQENSNIVIGEEVGRPIDADKCKKSGFPKRIECDVNKKPPTANQTASNAKSIPSQQIQWHGGRFNWKTKLKVIERVKRGESVTSIASELGTQVKSIEYWVSNHKGAERKYKKYTYEAKRLKKRESRHSASSESDGPAMLTARERPDKETILKACNRLREGTNYRTVAKEVGVSKATVQVWRYKYLPQDEILPKIISSKLSNKEVSEACNLLKQGESRMAVAKKFGVTLETVKTWQRKVIPETMGPIKKSSRRHKNHSKTTILAACKRLKGGESVQTVAKEFEVSEDTVMLWRRQHFPKEELKQMRSKYSKKYNEETVQEACNLLKQGNKPMAVAKKFGVAVGTVRVWQHKFVPESVVDSRNSSKYDLGQVLEACRYLKQGVSGNTVASRISVPRKTVDRWKIVYFAKIKVELGSKGSCTYDRFTMLEACDKLHQGVAVDVVAKELNIDVALVKKWKEENTLEVKSESQVAEKYDKKFILGVINRLRQGESVSSVAKKLGLCASTIYIWRNEYCLKRKSKPKDGSKYDKNIKLKACELLKQGNSNKKVAEKLNIAYGVVSAWKRTYLLRGECKRAYRGRYSLETKRKAFKLLKQGESLKSIVKKLDLNPTTADKWRMESHRRGESKPKFGEYLYRGGAFRQMNKRIGYNFILEGRFKKVNKHKVRRYVKRAKPFSRLRFFYAQILNDPKLMRDCFVVLEKNPKIDALCPKKIVEVNREAKKDGRANNRTPKSSSRRVFKPFPKVFVPKKMKVQVVKMIDKGFPIAQLSGELNVSELTINSWILNRNLLEK